VLFRCAIHGNITLKYGSVQMGVAKTHPDISPSVDGQLYYDFSLRRRARPAAPNSSLEAMNSRTLISGILGIVCLAAVWAVVAQQQKLTRLRAEQRLRSEKDAPAGSFARCGCI